MAATAQKSAQKTELAETLLAAAPRPGGEAGWAADARRAAADRLLAMGGPVARDEYWRYTDPAPLIAPEPEGGAPEARRPIFEDADALRIVFVDGVFDPAQSDPLELSGVEVQPLAEALATDIHWAKDLFGVLEAAGHDPVDRPLAALNTVQAAQGVAIRATAAAARPVDLIYRQTSGAVDAALRHLIRVDAGASLTVLKNGPVGARASIVTEALVEDGGALNLIRAQRGGEGALFSTHLFARLGAGAALKSFTLSVDGRLTRNEAVLTFAGDDAAGHIAGATVGRGGSHHDDTVFVTHDAERCESRQVFKNVLRDDAESVFQGKILVKAGAQKTDGYQISQALLLDDTAQFNAKPELEIYADDVACSHGSTCGSVDETALFYLTSRGVPRAVAENMLVLAFLDEAVAEIEDGALADMVRARIAGWVEGDV